MELIIEIEEYVIRTMQNSARATSQEIAILPTMIEILLDEKNDCQIVN